MKKNGRGITDEGKIRTFFSVYRFPSSLMLFGRKLPKLAESGNSEEILKILEKGGFGAEKYNESYKSFVEMEHRKEGVDILISAHEKFSDDTVSIFQSLRRYGDSLFLLTSFTTWYFFLKVILHNLASCYAFYKDYSKSCIYFKKLVDLQPEDGSVIGTYGRMLAMSGEVEEAKEQLRKALQIAEEKHEDQLIEQVGI